MKKNQIISKCSGQTIVFLLMALTILLFALLWIIDLHRLVPGKTHTNVIFDAVVPPGLPMTEEAVAERIRLLVADAYPNHYAVVDIDQSYV